MSASAWLVPDSAGLIKGYEIASRWTAQSVILLLTWWSLIYVGFRCGEILGKKAFKRKLILKTIDPLEGYRLFLIFTALAALGVVLTYKKIFSSLSPVEAFIFISSGQGNELKENLYENYSAGILSLRYLVVYSASLTVYRFIFVRKLDFLYLINIILLLLSVLLSSRLIFIATVLCAFFLVVSRSEKIKIQPLKMLVGIFFAFTALSSLNASRNSNYYAQDGLYFWGAGASSIVTYLGSPFQTAIGAANDISSISSVEAETYRKFVDVDLTLNTNSAFVQLHEHMGYFSWPYICVLTLGVGFLFSALLAYGRSFFLLPCAALLYASSELWRLDLFRQGIFLVWLAAGLIVPITVGQMPKVNLLKKSKLRYSGPVKEKFNDNTKI